MGLSVLLEQPCSEFLCDLKGIVIDNFPADSLSLVDWPTTYVLLYGLLAFLDDFIALFVSHIGDFSALVVSNVVGNAHEQFVVVEATGRGFQHHFLFAFSLKHQDAGLDTDVGLKRIGVQVDAGENSGALKNPFSYVS